MPYPGVTRVTAVLSAIHKITQQETFTARQFEEVKYNANAEGFKLKF